MNYVKYYIAIIILIFISVQINAQDSDISKDKLVLKNGSIIYGKLLNYNPSKIIEFKLADNTVLSIPDSNIVSIQTNYISYQNDMPDNYIKRFYSYVAFSLSPGNSISNSRYGSSFSGTGIGVEYTAQFRLSKYLFTGFGAGIQTYNTIEKAIFYPVFIDLMTLVKSSKSSPFFRIQLGYSPVSSSNEDYLTGYKGGLMFNPAFGIKFGTKNLDYTLDFNYKYQKASFDYKYNNSSSTKDIIYKRFSFRFGVLF